jgi:hypothetical protein
MNIKKQGDYTYAESTTHKDLEILLKLSKLLGVLNAPHRHFNTTDKDGPGLYAAIVYRSEDVERFFNALEDKGLITNIAQATR